MLIESLARLALVNEECKNQGITIVSEDFMKDTQTVIDSQIEALQKDMKFQVENPGPYVFGLGKYSITIFPPTYTESSDWVLILFNEETQIKERLLVFQSLLGLIENLGNAIKFIETSNASTLEQDREGETETGSVQTDSIADSKP
jgi:hypothetical protein